MPSKKKRIQKPASPPRGPATLLWVLALLAAALGVFWLPWHVGFAAPAPGESYALGFNNRVGVLALGLAIFLATGARYFSARRPEACAWLVETPQLFPRLSEARAEYGILFGLSGLLCGCILFWSHYLVDPAWCESRGFIYGMDLLALGQVPYRDFMYNYGPATIYLPFWLSNLSEGMLSFEQSYTFFLVVFTCLGFAALFVFLRNLEISRAARPWVLSLCLVPWLAISLGLQYTPLRFVIVPAALIFLNAVARRLEASGVPSLIKLGLAAALAAAASLAVSPEMGIACTAAVAAYGFAFLLRRSHGRAAACLLGPALVFIATLTAFPGYLESVIAFGSGGGNFPLYPNLHNLFLVGITLIILPSLLASSLADPGQDRAPLALALAVGGGMLLPASFGRCDPGHLAINSIVPVLMMFPAAAQAGAGKFRFWMVTYALVFTVFLQVSFWTQYVPNFAYGIKMHEMYETHPDLVAAWKAKWEALRLASPHGRDFHWSKLLPYPGELEQLTSQGRVLMTDGSEGTLWLARFLLLQRQPPLEYFDAYSQGAATPAQIEKKVRQCQDYRFLLVPESSFAPLQGPIDLGAYGKAIDANLTKLLFFPVSSEVRYSPYFPEAEFARRMLADFGPVGRYNGYLILARKNAPGNAP